MVVALAVAFTVSGCAGFWASRVEQLDSEIVAMGVAIEQAPPEMKAELQERLVKLKEERAKAVEHAGEESANRQAMVLAALGVVVTGIKIAKGIAT